MTAGQTRVLVLMLVIIGCEAFFSQPFRDALSGKTAPLTTAMFVPGPAGLPPVAAAMAAYGIGGVAMVALAGVAPGLATGLAVVFLIGVLLGHAPEVAGLAQAATAGITTLHNGAQTNAPATGGNTGGGGRSGVK